MSSALNGMPYFLVASSGDILNTDYTELYKRMNYRIRCTHRDPNLGRAAYMITEMSAPSTAGRPGVAAPFAALDFIADNQLGTVKVGSGEQMPMDQYLAKVSRKYAHHFLRISSCAHGSQRLVDEKVQGD